MLSSHYELHQCIVGTNHYLLNTTWLIGKCRVQEVIVMFNCSHYKGHDRSYILDVCVKVGGILLAPLNK